MENYLEILKDSLVKKKEVLEEIIKIDELQTKYFQEAVFDDEKTRKSFEEKGQYIEKLELLDSGFQTLFDKVKEQLEDNKDKYKEQIKEMQVLIKEVTDLSMTIEAQEQRNKELAGKRFASMRKELSNAKRSTSLAKKYYSTMNNILNVDPQFMDSKR